jgi:hypothetical protein
MSLPARAAATAMILRYDRYGVDVLPNEQIAKIIEGGASLIPIVLIDKVLGLLAPGFDNVADGHDPNSRKIEKRFHVVRALATDPDATHHDLVTRGDAGGAA